jgi:hypothetical protein
VVSVPGRAHPECTGGRPPSRSPSLPRYLRAAVRGPGGLLLLLLLLPARLRRLGGGGGGGGGGDNPGGGGGALGWLPLLPRETQGTLSRAAAPRPVSSLWLGHGGSAHRRACEVGECAARGGKHPRRLEGPEGRSKGARGAARGRPLGAVGRGQAADLGSAATARVFPAGRGGEGEGD